MASNVSFPGEYFAIDIGMYDGADAEYYAKRGFKVISYEANPLLAEAGASRFADIPVEVRNRAISGSASGRAKFYISNKSAQWSSLIPEIGARQEGSVEIEVSTCDLTFDLQPICNRIHLVKIDIEGADFVAVEQIARLSVMPSYISVENGGEKFISLLSSMGYDAFKFANQKFNSLQRVPKNSPHGNYVQHFFSQHSSGPFGEDIPGRWLARDEALRVSAALDLGRKNAPHNLWAESIGWFDMHARHSSVRTVVSGVS